MAALIQVLFAASAEAQTGPRRARSLRPAPHAGSWEVSGGLLFQGGFDLGSADADLTRNPATGTGPYVLFSTDSTLGSGIGAVGRLALYLSENLAIEAGVRIARPVLTIALSADAEAAPDQDADETVTQYVIDGSAIWHFSPLRGGRVVPFVGAGAGYIRDVHEGNTLIATGIEYHATAGVKWWFSERPDRLGLRGEAGVSVRDGGFDFEDGKRTVPIVSASLVYLF